MGIDVHGINFLRYARKTGVLGRTLTIGRQGLHLSEAFVKSRLRVNSDYVNETYCETLLKDCFGATEVDSVDNSDFENATLIFDMNNPPPEHLKAQYDTVFDGGCLEHVYNIPQALKNLSMLCKAGGQILHVLPANNFCGHGFWQFSPELFFSLYSEANGYSNTEVFVADTIHLSTWYKVHAPSNGKRVNIRSHTPLYVLVRTVLKTTDFSHNHVQQSDYVHEWSNPKKEKKKKRELFPHILSALRNSYLFSVLWCGLRSTIRNRIRHGRSDLLNSRNPGLSVYKVEALISA